MTTTRRSPARWPLRIAVLTALVLLGLSRTRFTVEESLDIEAPPEAVWRVLMDADSYSAWSTQLAWLDGEPVLGATLRLRLSVAGTDPYEFTPTVTALEPERQFTWLARTGLPRVFDGEHTFVLEPLDGGRRTRLVNREEYRGALSPVIRRLPMMKLAPAGFRKMNDEIRARVLAQRSASTG